MASLDDVSQQLNRYFALLILIFGTIGNVLNCCVLSQRILRANPCAVYFLISSIVNLVSILCGLTTRILASWQLDPTSDNDALCKLRAFLVFSSRTIGLWLITFATIDRWFLTSRQFSRRQQSSLPNTRRGILISFLLSIVLYSQMLYCYEAHRSDAPLACYGKSRRCRLLTDVVYSIFTISIPLILMVIFCLLIVANVHHLHIRIKAINMSSIVVSSRKKILKLKRTDYQLLRMLLVQVILLVMFCIPQALQKLYISWKPLGSETEFDDEVKVFLYNIELILAFIASGMPFYLYTLTGGTIFREASVNFLEVIYQKLKC